MKKQQGCKQHGCRQNTRKQHIRVKTAKRRKISSTRWLERQLNDPYVAAARRLGYRGRAAFKLAELDDKYHFLHPGQVVVDLGAAPGGWVQVAQRRIGKQGKVVGIDLQAVAPLPGAVLIQGDFMAPGASDKLKALLEGKKVDVVLSDLAPSSTGHAQTDHLRIVALVEAAARFAFAVLKPGGIFVAKVFAGGTESELLGLLKKHFGKVTHHKPAASRKESAEMFLVARGFSGRGPTLPDAGEHIPEDDPKHNPQYTPGDNPMDLN